MFFKIKTKVLSTKIFLQSEETISHFVNFILKFWDRGNIRSTLSRLTHYITFPLLVKTKAKRSSLSQDKWIESIGLWQVSGSTSYC